jgi:hypothetical protein
VVAKGPADVAQRTGAMALPAAVQRAPSLRLGDEFPDYRSVTDLAARRSDRRPGDGHDDGRGGRVRLAVGLQS